jgi:hypothetical protein
MATDEKDSAKYNIYIFTSSVVNNNNGSLLFTAKSKCRFKCWYNYLHNNKSVNSCGASEVLTVFTNMADCVRG